MRVCSLLQRRIFKGVGFSWVEIECDSFSFDIAQPSLHIQEHPTQKRQVKSESKGDQGVRSTRETCSKIETLRISLEISLAVHIILAYAEPQR